MLQQQDFLRDDSAAVLDMVAKDDSGKGDWGVRRKVRKCWGRGDLSSEEKWAELESEVARLEQGVEGQKHWAVSFIFQLGKCTLKGRSGSAAVVH